MAAYFVKTGGSDALDGLSDANAWATIAKVNAAVLQVGDIVRFNGGNTFTGRLEIFAADLGTALNPVIVESYGTGKATISNTSGHGIYVYNSNGVTIRNLILAGSGFATSSHVGIYLYTDSPAAAQKGGIRIEGNVEITGWKNGIEIVGFASDSSASGWNGITIEDIWIHDCRSMGIFSWGRDVVGQLCHANITIRRALVHGISGATALAGEKILGDGILLSNVDGALIERCVTHTLGHRLTGGTGGPIGQWCYRANAVTIQSGESYNNTTVNGATDGGGFGLDVGVTNSTVQRCYSHGNAGAGFQMAHPATAGRRAFSGNIFRYNISENDGRRNSYGGVVVWTATAGEIADCEVYHNTIYLVGPAVSGTPNGIGVWAVTDGLAIENNAVITTGGLRQLDIVTGQTGMVLRGNSYWSTLALRYGASTYASLATFRSGTGFETGYGVDSDPLLSSMGNGGTFGDASLLETMAAYRPQVGSPLTGAGTPIASRGSLDFFGHAISGFDIGAGQGLRMAVAHSGAANSEITLDGATSGSIGHTSQAELRLAVVSFGANQFVAGNEPTSVTYGAVAMAKQVTTQFVGSNDRASIYTRVAPSTGNQAAAFTLPAAGWGCFAVSSYTGVDQTAPVSATASNTGSGSPASVTCTTATGEVVVDAVCAGGVTTAPTIGANQTLVHDHVAAGSTYGAGSYKAGVNGGAMSWTDPAITGFAIAATSLKAAPEVPLDAPGGTSVGITVAVEVASGDITLVEPGGVLQGDLLVACIAYRSNAAFTVPSGWTLVQQVSTGNAVTGASAIASGLMAYIVRGASAPALTFTRTVGDVALGRISAYRGMAQTATLDASAAEVEATAVTATGIDAGLTTTRGNTVLVMACCNARSSSCSGQTAATDPTTGWTERAESNVVTGADVGLAVADAPKATAGATGALNWVANQSTRSATIVGAFRALHALHAQTGVFNLERPDANLAYGYKLAAATGAFALAGQAIATPWTPVELGAALLGWWDADDFAGFTLEDTNTRVTQWRDKVGSYGPSQASGIPARPVYSPAGWGGRPGVQFDGVNHHLTLDSVPFPSGASPCEIWALAEQTAPPVTDTINRIVFAYGNTGNTARRLSRTESSGVNRGRASAGTGAASISATNTTVVLTGTHVMRGVYSGTTVGVGVDGSSLTTAAAVPATATSRTRIGSSDSDPSGLRWQGSIATILVTGLLTTDEAADLQDWLEARIPSATPTLDANAGTFALAGPAANLARGYSVAADPGAFALAGSATNFPLGYAVAAAAQAFTLAGQAANFPRGYLVPAATGALALSGQAANVLRGYPVTADAGAFALGGPATGLLRGYRAAAETGAFALAGPATGLPRGYPLAATPGAFALAGADARLVHTIVLADIGDFVLAGRDAALSKGSRRLATEPASFTATGADARLAHTIVLADIGDFALAGVDAVLARGRISTAAPATFATTGIDAAFLRGRVVEAAPGAFAATGNAAGLLAGWRAPTDAGAFALSGNDAGLSLTDRRIGAAVAPFALTGIAAAFATQSARSMTADRGLFALSGSAAGVLAGFRLPAAFAAYTLGVPATGLLRGRVLAAEMGTLAVSGSETALLRKSVIAAGPPQAFAVSGAAAELLRGGLVGAATGSFAFNGVEATLERRRLVVAEAGSFAFTGVDATLVKTAVYKVVTEPAAFLVSGFDAGLGAPQRLDAEPGVFTLALLPAAFHTVARRKATSMESPRTNLQAAMRPGNEQAARRAGNSSEHNRVAT